MEMVLLILVNSTFPARTRSKTQSDLSSYPAGYFFFGGLLMILGAIGEWIVGNTFPFVVFGTFGKLPPHIRQLNLDEQAWLIGALFSLLGAFWLTFGGTLVPSFNAYGAYVTDPAQMAGQDGNPGNPLGLQTPAFNASFAFFLVFMGALSSYPLLFLDTKTVKANERPPQASSASSSSSAPSAPTSPSSSSSSHSSAPSAASQAHTGISLSPTRTPRTQWPPSEPGDSSL